MKRTKSFILLLGIALMSSLWPQWLFAHGLPKRIHGGLTATELDLGFEIYLRGNEIVVYVSDHDSPFSTDVFDGQVEIDRNVIALKSAQGGLMVGRTALKKPDLKKSVVTLRASVLPTPLKITFRGS